MTEVFSASKQRIGLGQKFGEGGEGAVYLVQGAPALIAKIYHPGKAAPEAKLAFMVANPPDDPTAARGHRSIAWPTELLYDAHRHFVGFLMPRVDDAVPLLEVFNPRLRAKTLPGFNRRYLHRTARNFASAMSALHAKNYVVGDVNEGNCDVRPDALVTVLDTDSFQVTATGSGGKSRIFPCPVGKEEYLPPELQGGKQANVVRTPDTDTFALAVLIFQLLMEGNHPYRCQWRGSGESPSAGEKISRGLYPHQKPPSPDVAPSTRMPPIDILHPRLIFLFQRCFVDGYRNPRLRPSADEWEHAIKDAEQALVDCPNGHIYSNHQAACPWCAASHRGVQTPLPPVPRPRPTPIPSVQPLTTPFAAAMPAPVTPPIAPAGPLPRIQAWLGQFTRRQKTIGGGAIAAALILALIIGPLTGGSSGNNRTHVFVPPATVQQSTSAAQVIVDTPAPTPRPTLPPGPTPTPSPDPLGDGCWTMFQPKTGLGAGNPAKPIEQWSVPPTQVISSTMTYTATIVTNRGTMTAHLLTDQAPATANNFICLARAGFFDNTSFDRILPGKALQAGDPTGTGQGGPGYHISDETVVGDYLPGTLAMVNSGPGTTGSQFFIFLSDLSQQLPKRYPIFGQLTSGLDVAQSIAANPNPPARIERVTITEQSRAASVLPATP